MMRIMLWTGFITPLENGPWVRRIDLLRDRQYIGKLLSGELETHVDAPIEVAQWLREMQTK